MPRCLFACLYLLLLVCPHAARSAPPVDLLTSSEWSLQTPVPADAESATVPAADAPGGAGQFLRVTVHTAVDPYYLIQLSHAIPADLPDGTRVSLHFWGRSPSSNPVWAVVEQAVSPYARVIDHDISLTPEWKEYGVTASVPGYGPSGLAARFQVGAKAGVIELAGITLRDQGLSPEVAQAQAALQPAAIQSRIRRYRMADLTVTVHDSHAHPVPGALVSVRQTRHAFLFGCNIFGLRPDDTSPEELAYQSRFDALFNYATLPFYWGAFETTPGKPDYKRLDTMAQWCRAHGITPKGHPLVWHQVYPSWAPAAPDAAIPLLHARVTDIVSHYKGVIGYWDVVNEANSPDTKTGEGAWIGRDGPTRVVGTALGWARTAGQGTPETFLYNDYDTTDKNLTLLTQLQQRHELPDAIGLQSHMHGGPWKLSRVWSACEAFARFGRPIHFTETTVVSSPAPGPIDYNKTYPDWITTPAGEAAQADYVAQFYTLLFSHPAVRAITWWDLSDRDAWLGAPAGLVRKDMTPKPAYDRLLTLIHKTWWTQAQGRTNPAGRYTAHAFYGGYQIIVTDSHNHKITQTVTLPEASGPHTVILTLPQK